MSSQLLNNKNTYLLHRVVEKIENLGKEAPSTQVLVPIKPTYLGLTVYLP